MSRKTIPLLLLFQTFALLFILTSAKTTTTSSDDSSQLFESHYSKIGDFPFYTGYLLANQTTNSNLFYQLIPAINKTINDSNPLILWLQGGPGCSSQYASWIEMGPLYVAEENGKLFPKQREVTWSKYYHLLLIDNPNDAGFSRKGSAKVIDTKTSQIEVYNALTRFFEIYPQLKKNAFFVFGESYAGHYVPYLAYEILNRGFSFNFSGIGIGNAWTDPFTQFASFADYSFAAGIIDNNFRMQIKNLEVTAQNLIKQGKFAETNEIFNQIEGNLSSKARTGGIFLNNYRTYESSDPSDPIFGYYGRTQDYLNSSEVKALYNVPRDFDFNLCNGVINNAWAYDQGTSVIPQLEYVLTKTRVLFFSGADDIECNTMGVLKFLKKLNWKGIDNFQNAKRQIWKSKEGVLGNAKTSTNLTFVTVYKSGHYVPFSQPKGALDLVKRFTDNNNNWSEPYLY